MTDRYSFKDAAAVFAIPESRLRYWAQTGFINPSIRAGGRRYYTFRDLIQIRAAKDLLDAGASVQKVRKNLESLRALLPEADYPASAMRIASDGETIVARDPDDILFEPLSGQLVMDFSIDALSSHIADILALPTSLRSAEIVRVASEPDPPPAREPAPLPAIADMLLLEPLLEVFAEGPDRDNDWDDEEHDQTQPLDIRPVQPPVDYRPVGDRAVSAYPLAGEVANDQSAPLMATVLPPTRARVRDRSLSTIDELAVAVAEELAGASGAAQPGASESAYEVFIRGCDAEDDGDLGAATRWYRRAIQLQPTLSSAHTNLGHVRYRQGDRDGARQSFERALELEPAQPEARFNLASLLEDSGDIERAVAELRRVLWTHPRFSDAHYNLARMLAKQGRREQAREHLTRYLQLDQDGDWSHQARGLLAALA